MRGFVTSKIVLKLQPMSRSTRLSGASIWRVNRTPSSYQPTARANGEANAITTDQNGDTSTVSGTNGASVPVNHSNSGKKVSYVVDQWFAVWNPQTSEGKGSFVPIVPLHNHNRTDLTSASTSLLKDAMEQISQREKERLAARRKGFRGGYDQAIK